MQIQVREWNVDDAKRVQRKVDEQNAPIWNRYQRERKAAIEAGKDPEEPPELPGKTNLPQMHYSGERMFEVFAEGDVRRDDVVEAIAQYIKANPRAPKPKPDRAADSSW